MKGDVILDESRHKEVAVIIALLQPDLCLLATAGDSGSKRFCAKQTAKLIFRACVNQDRTSKPFSAIKSDASCAAQVLSSSPR